MAAGGSSRCERIFSVCGDQRYGVNSTEYPYCCVASLQFIFQMSGNSEYSVCNGTGFLAKVNESYQIITAAHLTTHDENIPLSQVQISLGRNGDVYPYGMIIKQADDIWVHPNYDRESEEKNRYDLASILIEGDKDLTSNGFSDGKYFCLKRFEHTQSLQMSGYPGSVQNQEEWKRNTQWEVELTDCKREDMFIHYKNATTSGNSGSPIYTSINNECYVMAMHLSGGEECNTGLVFTEAELEMLDEIWNSDSDSDLDSDLDSDSDMHL